MSSEKMPVVILVSLKFYTQISGPDALLPVILVGTVS